METDFTLRPKKKIQRVHASTVDNNKQKQL